jgi:subtilase family serine protease
LNADPPTGRYIREIAWNDRFGSSGGGFSTIYPRPGFQSGFSRNSQRGVPDLAYDADVNGGVLVVWSSSGQGANKIFIFGGTSVGSPQMAAEIALIVQAFHHTQGEINLPLYSTIGSVSYYAVFMHDIEVGNNTFAATNSSGKRITIPGYDAKKRWDPVTGLGSLILGNTLFGIPGTKATLWTTR